MDEKKIDELLMSLDANVPDEWEGGLTCTPQNRDVVKAWLAKHRLTRRAADGYACDVENCKGAGVIHLCENHGL